MSGACAGGRVESARGGGLPEHPAPAARHLDVEAASPARATPDGYGSSAFLATATTAGPVAAMGLGTARLTNELKLSCDLRLGGASCTKGPYARGDGLRSPQSPRGTLRFRSRKSRDRGP
jgi:hypothetical protein